MKKNKKEKFYLNFSETFKIPGLVHVYATNLNHCLIDCNPLQGEIITEVLGIKKKEFIYEPLFTLFKNFGNLVDVSVNENEKVLSGNSTQQFYNILHIENNCRIEFLTTKIPFYNSTGKISGVFGISQYINKFSYIKASKLGLTKKEIICLSCLFSGQSNKQIATELHISVRTVEDHIENLRDKLNCASKQQLIFKAFKNNLMDDVHQKFIPLRNMMLRSSNDSGIKLISTDINF